jgi:hypothetical protein
MGQGEMTNANRVVFHIVAPPRPEPGDQRLPPMLRSQRPASVPAYSKGAWGLSVLLREGGIFTATSISPSLRSRQRPSRYAVHARRNLPDKELRYLRTVIVTAAVYRCFGRQLQDESLTGFLNIPAPSRRHSVYFLLRVCTELCF